MARRRVVLTGASGYVAQRMFAPLAERWDLVPLDVRATTGDGRPVPGLVVADLTERNRDRYRQHFRGADAVAFAAAATAALIVFRHRANMRRILDGTERRLGARGEARP